MRIDIVTIFPGYFDGPLDASLLGRARREGLLQVDVLDLREAATGVHRSVDDAPYGGGAGMVMAPEPFFALVEGRYGSVGARPRTVVLTPRGVPLSQPLVTELAAEPALLLLCGRYEGIDERVHLALATDEVSVGDYVLAGGEAAATVLLEAVTRLLPGVMGNPESRVEESFASGLLEYPQYTRPASLRGLDVPEILRSGDHGSIAAWRHRQALARTRKVRPDLYARYMRQVAAREGTQAAAQEDR